MRIVTHVIISTDLEVEALDDLATLRRARRWRDRRVVDRVAVGERLSDPTPGAHKTTARLSARYAPRASSG